MPWQQVEPVIDPRVRELCTRPYPGHPRGCPNHGKRATCPPQAKGIDQVLDLAGPVWAVWNCFDLAAHVARLRAKHPDWSWRQLTCCLYWQGGARKCLATEVRAFKTGSTMQDLVAVNCPEACGVNVTATMALAGVALEWPPRTITYQVALVGAPAGPAR